MTMMRLFNIDIIHQHCLRPFLSGTLVLALSATMAACQSIEMKNQQLQDYQSRLLKNPEDVAALSQVVKMLRTDPSVVARANAAATLGTVAEKYASSIKELAVPALIEALEAKESGVRDAAARALVKFGPLAKDAIPALKKNLVPSDTSVAWFSAEALGEMRQEAREAVPDLVRVLKENQETCLDNTAHICHYAAVALGKIGPAAVGAIPDITPLLDHKNPYLRAQLAVAIIRIDPAHREALGVLEKLLKDSDEQVRRATIWSLDDAGKEATPATSLIEAALKDPDESVRNTASELLRTLKSPKKP